MDNPPISDDMDPGHVAEDDGRLHGGVARCPHATEHQPDWSWPSTEKMPSKFAEVTHI